MFVSAPHFCLAGHSLFNHLALLTGHSFVWKLALSAQTAATSCSGRSFSRSVSTSLLWQWRVVFHITQTLSQIEGKVLVGENFPIDPDDKQKYWHVHQQVNFGPFVVFPCLLMDWWARTSKAVSEKIGLIKCVQYPAIGQQQELFLQEWVEECGLDDLTSKNTYLSQAGLYFCTTLFVRCSGSKPLVHIHSLLWQISCH